MTTMNNTEEQANTLSLNKSLQDARLIASLTVDQVADKLHLSASIIHEIEDDLEDLIENKKYPIIYLRGYIANYAKLVKLDKFPEFEEYKLLSVTQKVRKNICPPIDVKPTKKRRKWLVLLLIISVLAIGLFLIQQFFFSESNFFQSETKTLELKPEVTDNSLHLAVDKKLVSDEINQ